MPSLTLIPMTSPSGRSFVRAKAQLQFTIEHYCTFVLTPLGLEIHRSPNTNQTSRKCQGFLQARWPLLASMYFRSVNKDVRLPIQCVAKLRDEVRQEVVIHPPATWLLVRVAQEHIVQIVHNSLGGHKRPQITKRSRDVEKTFAPSRVVRELKRGKRPVEFLVPAQAPGVDDGQGLSAAFDAKQDHATALCRPGALRCSPSAALWCGLSGFCNHWTVVFL
jgi:hypothetical protein